MCRATYWKWKRKQRHKSSFFVNISLSFSFPSPLVNVYKKGTTPYFPWCLKDVDEAEEKVVSVGEMFYSWIIISCHNGIGYNIMDDITRVGARQLEISFQCVTLLILSSISQNIFWAKPKRPSHPQLRSRSGNILNTFRARISLGFILILSLNLLIVTSRLRF